MEQDIFLPEDIPQEEMMPSEQNLLDENLVPQDNFPEDQEGIVPEISPEELEEIERAAAESELVENEDGSKELIHKPKEEKSVPKNFYENLVVEHNFIFKQRIGEIHDAIEGDIKSRSEWVETLKKGIKLLNINPQTYDDKGPFETASGAISPVFMQTYLNLTSMICAQLLPPGGPADTEIQGNETMELVERAKRVKNFINYDLTIKNYDYYAEKRRVYAWASLMGSVFTKVYWSHNYKRPEAPFISPENVIVNYGVSSLQGAERITYQESLTFRELRERQIQGYYIDIELMRDGFETDDDEGIREQIDETEGMQLVDDRYYKRYTIREVQVDLDIPELRPRDEHGHEISLPVPYKICYNPSSMQVLAAYRNYEPHDFNFKRIDNFVHHKLITGLGFYGLGLAHVAGGSAEAATVITRQMIDSGTKANLPGGFYNKGHMKLNNYDLTLEPGKWKPLELGNVSSEQIFITPPYKSPDPMLKQLKDEMEQSIRDIPAVLAKNIADMNFNGPVGTTLLLLEKADMFQNAVLNSLHEALGHELRIIYRLYGENLPENPQEFKEKGQVALIHAGDFNNDLRIIPVAEPNVNASTMRRFKAESILNMAKQAPELHNMYEVYKRLYTELDVPEIDKILIAPEDTQPTDPVTTVQNIMQGKAVVAAPWQNHEAYIAIIQNWMQSNPDNPNIPAAQAAITEHQAYLYKAQIESMLGQPLPENLSELPPEVQNEISMVIAEVQMQQQQEMMAQQQQMMPPPVDPNAVLEKDVEVKAQGQQLKYEMEMNRLAFEKEKLDREEALKEAEMARKSEIELLKLELEKMKAELKNLTDQQENLIDAEEVSPEQEFLE